MSLYGNTDSAPNVTKAGRGVSPSSQAKQIIFIDNTEAALPANKERGLNAPGWWSYYTYTDGEGHTRHKAEHLVTIANPVGPETQADDAVAADEAVLITINTQTSAFPYNVGDPINLVVDAIATPPGDASVLTYQWQKRSGRRWINVGADQPTYDVAVSTADDVGTYRVKINSTNGASEVISDAIVVELNP